MEKQRGKFWPVLGVVMLILGLKWFSQEMRLSTDPSLCASHIRRLGLVTLAYAEDHQGQLPLANIERELRPYARQFGVTSQEGCPVARRQGEPSYTVNPTLGGVSLRLLRDDSRYVLIYEGGAGRIALRHHGGAYYYFADGRLGWYPGRLPLRPAMLEHEPAMP